MGELIGTQYIHLVLQVYGLTGFSALKNDTYLVQTKIKSILVSQK